MYKLVYGNQTEQDEFEKNYGGYNFAPPNLKEISQAEFFRALNFSPRAVSYKQVMEKYDPSVKGKLYLHMFIFNDGTGVGYTNDYLGYGHDPEYKQTFYKFAVCEHEYEHTRNLGRCYNEYRCTKCKRIKTVDSSD